METDMFSENPFMQACVPNHNQGQNPKKKESFNVPKDSVPKDSDASERFRLFRVKAVPSDSVHHNIEMNTIEPKKFEQTNPAVLNVTTTNQVPSPIYTISGQQPFTEEVLQRQENELNSWEKDLERREEELWNHPSNQGSPMCDTIEIRTAQIIDI